MRYFLGHTRHEVCFGIKLRRKGILKWLENKKIIKPKTEYFALDITDWNSVEILSSNEESFFIITSTKVNRL